MNYCYNNVHILFFIIRPISTFKFEWKSKMIIGEELLSTNLLIILKKKIKINIPSLIYFSLGVIIFINFNKLFIFINFAVFEIYQILIVIYIYTCVFIYMYFVDIVCIIFCWLNCLCIHLLYNFF